MALMVPVFSWSRLGAATSVFLSRCASVLDTLGTPDGPGITQKWICQVEISVTASGTNVPMPGWQVVLRCVEAKTNARHPSRLPGGARWRADVDMGEQATVPQDAAQGGGYRMGAPGIWPDTLQEAVKVSVSRG